MEYHPTTRVIQSHESDSGPPSTPPELLPPQPQEQLRDQTCVVPGSAPTAPQVASSAAAAADPPLSEPPPYQATSALEMGEVPTPTPNLPAFVPGTLDTPEWPAHPVFITLKNTGKTSIQYRYTQEKHNESGTGTVMAGQILPEPVEFIMFTSYNFHLRAGRNPIPLFSHIFVEDGDWDLARYFV